MKRETEMSLGIGVLVGCAVYGLMSCGTAQQPEITPHDDKVLAGVPTTPLPSIHVAPAIRPGAPQYVTGPIPSMRVVPVHADGDTLTPPSDPEKLGWWKDGAKVGAKNGAVLLFGHTVSSGSAPLNDLEDVAPGQKLTVSTGKQAKTYTIRSVKIRSKEWVAKNAARIYGTDGPHRLILMTCEDYDPSTREYKSNVIVEAL